MPQRLVDAVHQHSDLKRLAQEADRAERLRLSTDSFVRKCGDEHYRYLIAITQQSPVQLKAAHSRHLYVRDEAIRTRDGR